MEQWFQLTDDTETLATDRSAYLEKDFENRDRDRYVRERQLYNEAVYSNMKAQQAVLIGYEMENFVQDNIEELDAARKAAAAAALATTTAAPATTAAPKPTTTVA